MDNLNNSEVFQNIKRIMIGCIISIILTLILLLIFSIILTYTSISENTQKPVIIVISTISILIGASISSFKLKKKRHYKWRYNRFFLYYNYLFTI